MQHVLFDLDGTLSDATHRLWHLEQDPIDWDAFHLASADDTPITPLIEIARGLYSVGKDVHILTGRSEIARNITLEWLRTHTVPFTSLCMRHADCRQPDHELKPRFLEPLGIDPANVFLAFEDRTRVVNAWRALGIRTLQVAPGDF